MTGVPHVSRLLRNMGYHGRISLDGALTPFKFVSGVYFSAEDSK